MQKTLSKLGECLEKKVKKRKITKYLIYIVNFIAWVKRNY
ncbi:hypothetical protein NARC_10312 [Candidatus Nitrosocosmicus arcticus]|uniref:Uncharacterized protein n=1 Tax=Candidatus Nitrosocosmicus arcticus TaxID=2035267 RepID=A0A557SZ90_9ARCH|nr:hypothetical protein NARC_10312 [Candidatus Nitrosocosmicus arcticus]